MNFIQTSIIFSSLKYYWIINFNGDLENLKYITSAMNYLDEDFDLNQFIYKESSYIKKLLDWEIEESFLYKLIFSFNIHNFLS